MLIRYDELYGMPCGVCSHPAHHSEGYPNGVRIVHMNQSKRPCNSMRPAASNQLDRRGFEPRRDILETPVPARPTPQLIGGRA